MAWIEGIWAIGWAAALIVALGSFGAAWIVEVIILGVLRRLASKTKTELDDIVLDLLKRPIYVSLLMVGFDWAIRRWVADSLDSPAELELTWHLRAQNLNGGDGTGGILFHNGLELDSDLVGGTDADPPEDPDRFLVGPRVNENGPSGPAPDFTDPVLDPAVRIGRGSRTGGDAVDDVHVHGLLGEADRRGQEPSDDK